MYRRFSSIVPSAAVFLDAPSASPVRQPWLSIPGFLAPVGVLAASIGLPADLPDAAFSSTQSNSSRPDTAGPLDSHRFVHSQFVARCGYAILGKTCDDSVPFWYLSRATCRDSAVEKCRIGGFQKTDSTDAWKSLAHDARLSHIFHSTDGYDHHDPNKTGTACTKLSSEAVQLEGRTSAILQLTFSQLNALTR